MKSHEKESIHPIALSPNISSLENETKSPLILICNEKKNQIFYMLWQYKLDKTFVLTFGENRALLSSTTAKICFKMLMKSLVNHFLSTEFSIWAWQTLKLVLFYNHFLKIIIELQGLTAGPALLSALLLCNSKPLSSGVQAYNVRQSGLIWAQTIEDSLLQEKITSLTQGTKKIFIHFLALGNCPIWVMSCRQRQW